MKIYFPGGKRITVEYKGFSIITDQSVQSHGFGAHPSPFDLFKASLGTCMAYYVMMFCTERDIPLDSVYVQLEFKEEQIIQSIDVRIVVDHRFPEKYLGAVVKATEACKVKKQLLHPPDYSIKAIVEDPGNGRVLV